MGWVLALCFRATVGFKVWVGFRGLGFKDCCILGLGLADIGLRVSYKCSVYEGSIMGGLLRIYIEARKLKHHYPHAFKAKGRESHNYSSAIHVLTF